MTQSPNIDLYLPNRTDNVEVDTTLASNFTKIDAKIGDHTTQLTERAKQNVLVETFKIQVPEVNDSGRIQRAINYAIANKIGKVVFTLNQYTINTTLNLTNISEGIILEGMGMSANGTVIYGLTSGTMFDCSGSPYVQIKNIQLKARYEANASTIGILFARTTVNGYAEFSLLENVKIDLGSIPTANNGNGTIGIYNYGAELHRYRNIYVIADRTVCFVYNNTFNITSPFATLSATGVSMSECVIDGSSTLTGYANTSVRIDQAVNIKFDNIYMLLGQSSGANNNFAFEIVNSADDIFITGHIESYNQFLNIKNAQIQGLFTNVSKQIMNASDQIYLDGVTGGATMINGGKIRVFPMLNAGITHNLINQAGTIHNGIINCDIYLYANQNLNAPSGYVTGNTIRAEKSSSTITVSGAGYNNSTLILKQDKAKMYGNFEMDNAIVNSNIKLGTALYVFGGAAPTDGTWNLGDRVKNNFPVAGGYEGWICVTAGTPGTWKGYGLIQA